MTVTRLIARPMLASMFIVGGVNALKHTDKMAERAKPVIDKVLPKVKQMAPGAPIPTDPKTLVRINAGVQLGAGLAFATGRAPRLSALVLAASLVPTTAAGHPFWEETEPTMRTNQKLHFFKNMSTIGGLLLAGVDTEGKPGVVWRTRHAATDVRREAKHLRGTARREAKLAAKSLKG